MGAGSRHADADEQPRRGSRRASAGPRRVWRNRPRRSQLGVLPRHRELPSLARERRDAAGAVGQAGRGFSYARLCAARAHLQLQPGWPLVELGEVQRTGEAGPNDVRPDDGRLVDLHRVAGHHPGNIRDVLRCRRKSSGRRPRRQADRLRRHGRNERSPASGRDHDGRMLPRHRGRSRTHQETSSQRAIATSWSTRSTKRCAS